MADLGGAELTVTKWAVLVVFVHNKNCGMRFCVDYRRTNAATEQDSYYGP